MRGTLSHGHRISHRGAASGALARRARALRPLAAMGSTQAASPLQSILDDPQRLVLLLALAAAVLAILTLLALVILFRLRARQRRAAHEARVKRRLQESLPDIRKAQAFGTPKEPPKQAIPHKVTVPPSRLLAPIGARTLLEQVNHHMLKGRGEISAGKGELRLVWTDAQDQIARSIMITVQDAQTLLINGKPFPATRKGVQQGLVDCLRGLK